MRSGNWNSAYKGLQSRLTMGLFRLLYIAGSQRPVKIDELRHATTIWTPGDLPHRHWPSYRTKTIGFVLVMFIYLIYVGQVLPVHNQLLDGYVPVHTCILPVQRTDGRVPGWGSAATKRTATKITAPKRTAPKMTAPKKTAPKRTAPKRTAPKRTAPKRTAPKRTATKRTATKRTATKRTAPKMTAPKRTAPKRIVPKRIAPKRTAPKRTAPKRTAPKRTAPKRTAPKTH